MTYRETIDLTWYYKLIIQLLLELGPYSLQKQELDMTFLSYGPIAFATSKYKFAVLLTQKYSSFFHLVDTAELSTLARNLSGAHTFIVHECKARFV